MSELFALGFHEVVQPYPLILLFIGTLFKRAMELAEKGFPVYPELSEMIGMLCGNMIRNFIYILPGQPVIQSW